MSDGSGSIGSIGDALAVVNQVIARYCRALDTKDMEALAAVFAPNATLVVPGGTAVVGSDAICALYKPILMSSRETKHFVTNVDVEIDDNGKLRSTSYLFATRLKVPFLWISWGTYSHTFESLDGAWVITDKKITLDVPEMTVTLATTHDRWRSPAAPSPNS